MTSTPSAARPRSSCSPAPSPPSATSASTRGSCARTRCCGGCCTRRTRSRRRSTATRRSRATSWTWPSALILEVAHEDSRKDFRSIEQLLDSELDKLQKLSLEGTPITGTPSGFEDLDTITGGFQPGNLIILAARPSMGKSALMANFAENAALDSNKAVALFSLEMSEGELAQRFIASQASIKGDDLRKGRVPQARWGKILAASARLAHSKLFIDDSSDLSVLDVRAKCRRLAQQNADGLGLILIDYLQLMRAGGSGPENRVEQIGQISRGLKTLARELEVPVIALSQLNRGVEQRKPTSGPMLSDLRESGAIEQDADLVMFVYRDDYYDKESEREGIADLIIAKHRNGGLGTVELTFQKEFPRFMSYAGGRPVLMAACPDGRCDGSGFLFDEETRRAYPCSCRPRAAGAQAGGGGRRADPEGVPRGRRSTASRCRRSSARTRTCCARCAATATRSPSSSRPAAGMWFTGDRRDRQDDAGDADLQDRDGGRPHGRDLLAAAAAGDAARDVPRGRAATASAS